MRVVVGLVLVSSSLVSAGTFDCLRTSGAVATRCLADYTEAIARCRKRGDAACEVALRGPGGQLEATLDRPEPLVQQACVAPDAEPLGYLNTDDVVLRGRESCEDFGEDLTDLAFGPGVGSAASAFVPCRRELSNQLARLRSVTIRLTGKVCVLDGYQGRSLRPVGARRPHRRGPHARPPTHPPALRRPHGPDRARRPAGHGRDARAPLFPTCLSAERPRADGGVRAVRGRYPHAAARRPEPHGRGRRRTAPAHRRGLLSGDPGRRGRASAGRRAGARRTRSSPRRRTATCRAHRVGSRWSCSRTATTGCASSRSSSARTWRATATWS